MVFVIEKWPNILNTSRS